MKIKQEIRYARTLLEQGSNLLLLRLQLLHLDLSEQTAGILKIAAMITTAAIALMVGLIALLFGLNAWLPPHFKAPVFFGITVLMLLFFLTAVLRIPSIWRHSSRNTGNTLRELQQDLACLREQFTGHEIESND